MRISSSHLRIPRFIRSVRLALQTLVMWIPPLTPPVRLYMSQLSMVPNLAFPDFKSSFRPLTLSISHDNFVAEK